MSAPPGTGTTEGTGAEIRLKHESLAFTTSSFEPGALTKLPAPDDAARAAGVIAMSAGNHAREVFYRAQRLGIAATTVMPRFTPDAKVEHMRTFKILEEPVTGRHRPESVRIEPERLAGRPNPSYPMATSRS